MRVVRALALAGVALLAICGGIAWFWTSGDPAPTWRTAAVARQDVRARVSSTGVLQAVTTVTVGTQVSGKLAEVLVDFNDTVTAGQVLARLDTTLLSADVESASAAYAVQQAGRDQKHLARDRVAALHAHGSATDVELEQARTDAAVADAQVRQAGVSLARARSNLAYATITAPIAGTVLRRDVEAGQTVNAGMSAPTLFVLAGDLGSMQILAAVDEADIGRIAPGQPVEFTVQAYPDRKFAGSVAQVRLQSATSENVVTYTVVVAVENADHALLPGMTATVDFVVDHADAVLCAPNAALRFRPEPEWIDPAAREAWAAKRGGPPPGGSPGAPPAGGSPGGRSKDRGTLWIAGDDGLTPISVRVGLADAQCTQVDGEGLPEGAEVITGAQSAAAPSAGGSLFSPAPSRSRPGGF